MLQATSVNKLYSCTGMSILNPLPRAEGSRRGTWKTHSSGSRNEEELYKLIVSNFEQKNKELMLESHELREHLILFDLELSTLLRTSAPEVHHSMFLKTCLYNNCCVRFKHTCDESRISKLEVQLLQ